MATTLIDLHSHILPGIDDGARDMDQALAMARIAIADGVRVMAATPHITAGIYNNDAWIIAATITDFQVALDEAGFDLEVVMGADVHISPGMGAQLRQGAWPRLAGSRYFLFEPPHHVLPPGLERLAASLIDQGLVPVLTHPERLTWIESHYDIVCKLERMGVAVQVTAAAITGQFGRRARYWSERLLDEDRVDLVASDAHNTSSRRPGLARARDAIAGRLGEASAWRLVRDNPKAILRDGRLPQKKHRDGTGGDNGAKGDVRATRSILAKVVSALFDGGRGKVRRIAARTGKR